MMFDVLLIYKYKSNIYNNQEKYGIQNFDVIVKTKHDQLQYNVTITSIYFSNVNTTNTHLLQLYLLYVLIKTPVLM